MTDRPINCTVETVRAIRACRQTEIYRPGVFLAKCRPGERLWVREPIHLPRQVEGLAPTAALDIGARPWYAADGKPSRDYGRARMAREMPRAWHRMHLSLIAVDRMCLREIDDAGARAAGCRNRAAFAEHWDAVNGSGKTSISHDSFTWADNPAVTRLRFDWVDLPLPLPAAPARATQRGVAKPSEPPLRPAAPDRTPCPRCGVRADIGCEHQPRTEGAHQCR
ncbi:hypothetical protein [Stakelama tenebrarum]|uniref:Uncharacterized protein n=1 Tax=Stakelama tenebrarum TaxID=2711215 RepID=A0A6G6Y563_9SPHN|nr:hypothetical protein [Sphingosinithalassobacter tenebrarum]QIG80072.1 hypothetical protein G5C33_09960 [Sphingosinithalassobacter tenebrarum]